jgi:hypothetical protein
MLFFLERIQHLANVAGLPRNLHEYARSNLMVAPSGILSHRYLRWALEVVGAGRIVFSTDYQFEAASQGAAPRISSRRLSCPSTSGPWWRAGTGI